MNEHCHTWGCGSVETERPPLPGVVREGSQEEVPLQHRKTAMTQAPSFRVGWSGGQNDDSHKDVYALIPRT